jgi:hypothetical protein
MTDHTARPESWETVQQWADSVPACDCLMDLRARVERLEQAQQPEPEGPNLAGQLARTMEQRLPRVLHFHGVPLVPPIDCPDPMLWIAERVYEMAQQQQPAPNTPAGLVSDVAELIARFASTSRAGDDCTPAASEVLHKVADWLADNGAIIGPSLLRREVGR